MHITFKIGDYHMLNYETIPLFSCLLTSGAEQKENIVQKFTKATPITVTTITTRILLVWFNKNVFIIEGQTSWLALEGLFSMLYH